MARIPLIPMPRTAAGVASVTVRSSPTRRRKKVTAKKRRTKKTARPRRKNSRKVAARGRLKKGSPAAKRRMAQLRRMKARKR